MALQQPFWKDDPVIGQGAVPGAAGPAALPPPPLGVNVPGTGGTEAPPPPEGETIAAKPGATSPTKRVLTPDELKQKYPHLDPQYSYQEVTNPEGGPAGVEVLPRTGGKQLKDTRWDKIKADVSQYSGLKTSLDTFNPEFAGNIAGGAENLAQGVLGDRNSGMLGVGTPGQRQWWAQFYANDNLIRNALYGASLTASEQAAYERTTIAPGMDPEIVRANLAERQELIRKAISRDRKAAIAEGYNKETLDALAGDYVEDFDREEPGVQTATGETVPGTEAAPGETAAAGTVPPGGAPPPVAAIGEPKLELAQGEWKTVPNPAKAGANAMGTAMVRGGYSDAKILGALKEKYDLTNKDLLSIKNQLPAVRKHWKENKGFTGSYFDIENMTEKTSAMERISASPAGALGIAAADTFTGGHMDNIIGWTGGDAEAASVGIDASRAANPAPPLRAMSWAAWRPGMAAARRSAGWKIWAGRLSTWRRAPPRRAGSGRLRRARWPGMPCWAAIPPAARAGPN